MHLVLPLVLASCGRRGDPVCGSLIRILVCADVIGRYRIDWPIYFAVEGMVGVLPRLQSDMAHIITNLAARAFTIVTLSSLLIMVATTAASALLVLIVATTLPTWNKVA